MSKEWYNDQAISIMLNEYSKNNYQVELPIDNKDQIWMPRKIKNVIHEIEKEGINCVAMPINLGHNHWTGLVLKKNDKETIEAHYNDSFGTPMEINFPKLKQNLLKNGIKVENIHDYQLKQQNNDYDCGPWTVFNLDALARGEKLYNPNDETKNASLKPDIMGQRQALPKLMKALEGEIINDTNYELDDIKDISHKKNVVIDKQKISTVTKKHNYVTKSTDHADKNINKKHNINYQTKKSVDKSKKTPKINSKFQAVIETLATLNEVVRIEIEKIKHSLSQSVKSVKNYSPRKNHPKKESKHVRKM